MVKLQKILMLSIIRTSTIPNRYLNDIYINRLNNDVSDLSFYELREIIFGFFINEFDQYSHYLNKSKKHHLEEIIYNDSILQKKWAQEHGFSFNLTLDEIFIEQIKFYKPEILLDNNNYFMNHDATSFKFKYNISIIIAWDCYTGSNFNKQSKGVDLVLTCVEYIKNVYQDLGFKSELLPFGFDKRIIIQLENELNFKNQLCFTGSISDNVHKERKDVLLNIIRSKIPFELYISNLGKSNSLISRAQIRALKDFRFNDFWDYYKLQSYNKGGVYGIDMYKTIGESAIQINSHGDGSKQAGNMRLFEATGMGTLLLTDWKENLKEIFTPDEEVITYRNKTEALDKIKYFLKNEKEAKEIALNGQKKTLNKYSAELRIKKLEEILINHFNKN